jgi:HSP20 family protein
MSSYNWIVEPPGGFVNTRDSPMPFEGRDRMSDGACAFACHFADIRIAWTTQDRAHCTGSIKEVNMAARDESRNKQQGGVNDQASAQQGGSSSSPQQDQFNAGGGQQGGTAASLWRGGPFELVRRLDEDMDRLFGQLWGGGRSLMRGRGSDMQSMWMPQVEVFERGGKLHVRADLPGLKKDDVKLSVESDQLVLQGERRSSHEEGDEQSGYFHSERSYGSFYRTVPLPEGVDPSKAEATFKDGVLEVRLDAPSRQQPQARQIDIREG